ncbi:MAG: 4Fe-4S dicluster domain-containing protein [Hyphomicrobiales bacterium]|nr:4Fe-4S dicluster domain-containing protein [Hyphomicrobiales bacterium]
MPDRENACKAFVLDETALDRLIRVIRDDGFRVVAPRVVDGAIALGDIVGLNDLPIGWRSEEAPGHVRLRENGERTVFDHGLPAQAWKRYLYPPQERLWRARREESGFSFEQPAAEEQPLALFGVRSCDLEALAILDRVLADTHIADPRYAGRRQTSLIVAVNCTRPGGLCFCASMATGPGVKRAADLIVTELSDNAGVRLLMRPGSERGQHLLERVHAVPASDQHISAAADAVSDAAKRMGRDMPADVADVIRDHLDDPHWHDVEQRCLTCGNCTLVCPTCFCSTIKDTTDLSGATAERWRQWDSCFSLDFSYIHGGQIRQSGGARYRQWMAHKLAFWWDQFGTSGCVGCGRCIAWCPVGIDITEEARALKLSAERT